MITVTRVVTFDAAHRLVGYEGPCANLHGHTYKLEVTVEGPIRAGTGMVMDFKELDLEIRQVTSKLDHVCLNDVFDPSWPIAAQPTAERLVDYIVNQLLKPLPLLRRVRLWETPDSYATWEAGL